MPSEFVCPLTIPVIGPVLLCLSEFSVGRNPVIPRDLPTLAGLSIPNPPRRRIGADCGKCEGTQCLATSRLSPRPLEPSHEEFSSVPEEKRWE